MGAVGAISRWNGIPAMDFVGWMIYRKIVSDVDHVIARSVGCSVPIELPNEPRQTDPATVGIWFMIAKRKLDANAGSGNWNWMSCWDWQV